MRELNDLALVAVITEVLSTSLAVGLSYLFIGHYETYLHLLICYVPLLVLTKYKGDLIFLAAKQMINEKVQ